MDHIKTTLPAIETAKFSTPSLPKPNAARMRAAADAYDRIMRTRPDYGKETPEYAMGFTESLSYLSDEELAWVTHPREGLHTVCKFLPTAADLFEFIRKKREPFEKFKAFGKTPAEREPEDKPLTRDEVERRRAIVRNTLGYDPVAKHAPVKRPLTRPTDDEVRSLKLTTPAAPVSEELKKLLWQQGYFKASHGDAA